MAHRRSLNLIPASHQAARRRRARHVPPGLPLSAAAATDAQEWEEDLAGAAALELGVFLPDPSDLVLPVERDE